MTVNKPDPVHEAKHDNHMKVLHELVQWKAGRKEEAAVIVRFKDDPRYSVHVSTWSRNDETTHLIIPMLSCRFITWREQAGDIGDIIKAVFDEHARLRGDSRKTSGQLEIVMPRAVNH